MLSVVVLRRAGLLVMGSTLLVLLNDVGSGRGFSPAASGLYGLNDGLGQEEADNATLTLCHTIVSRAKTDLSWVCRLDDESAEDEYLRGWFETRFSDEEKSRLSKTGRKIFLEDVDGKADNAGDSGKQSGKENRTLTILVWRHGLSMERRLLRSYGDVDVNPFGDGCSVHNCRVSYDESKVEEAHAVLFHLHRIAGPEEVPPVRLPHQRWVFMTDESPHHTFMNWNGRNISLFNNIFNWSMAYRSDTDVPVPYGRVVPRAEPDLEAVTNLRAKGRLMAVLASNSGGTSKRYLPIDRWGGAGRMACAGHFQRDCRGIDDYRFYIASENSVCKDYITEKLWWNAYRKESIPVVIGGLSRADYARLAPPRSFLHADDFDSPRDLADMVLFLDTHPEHMVKFHKWRKYYVVLNEHGYFGAPIRHYCRLCEALNADDGAHKTYDRLYDFWHTDHDCRSNLQYMKFKQ